MNEQVLDEAVRRWAGPIVRQYFRKWGAMRWNHAQLGIRRYLLGRPGNRPRIDGIRKEYFCLLPGFGGPSTPALPPPPPPTPTADDPSIAVAKNKQQLADATRRGRASTILTAGAALGDTTTDRPTATGSTPARSAALLGD